MVSIIKKETYDFTAFYLYIMSKYFLNELLPYCDTMSDNICYTVMIAYLANIHYESSKYLELTCHLTQSSN